MDRASRAGRTRRGSALIAWAVVLAGGLFGLYGYVFHREWLLVAIASLSEGPGLWKWGVYLVLGCLRGFTLVPATYLLAAGMLVLPPLPLYLLTLAGIAVSSTAVYCFAESMGVAAFFERRHAARVARLRLLMQRHELPIVIAWSFLPIAPTDLICYVCGALEVDLRICLIGVLVGEGAICALYVALGSEVLAWLG